MFKIPIWYRRAITPASFLVLLWLAATGDTGALRVMAFAFSFWVPFSLHLFWKLADANGLEKRNSGADSDS
jgi:hypothetical protein